MIKGGSSVIKGYDGTSLIPIGVDSNGNMICVMKGNYNGTLTTFAVDSAGRGIMKLTDLEDEWGDNSIIGLTELAARIHAPPMLFKTTGHIKRWIDFESSTLSYELNANGGTISRSTDFALNGTYSAKLVGLNNLQTPSINLYTSDFHLGKLGIQLVMYNTTSDGVLQFGIKYHDGNGSVESAVVHYYFNTQAVHVQQMMGDTYVGSIPNFTANVNFSTIKLIFDLSTFYYTSLYMYGNRLDLTNYSIDHSASGSTKHLEIFAKIQPLAAPVTAYIDNIILTDME